MAITNSGTIIIDTTTNGTLKSYYKSTGALKSTATYKAQVKLSVSRDNKSGGSYTISVHSVRTYCTYSWAFTPSIDLWIGTSSAGANAKTNSDKTPNSSNCWNINGGWGPWCTDIKTSSLTVKAKSDGSCPTVWLYCKNSTGTVSWGEDQRDASTSCSVSKNIAADIEAAVGTVDTTTPKISEFKVTSATTSSISVSLKSDVSCTASLSWDGGTAESLGTSAKTSFTKTKSGLTGATNHTVKATIKYGENNNTASKTLTVDNSLPVISDYSLVPLSTTKIQLDFKSGTACNYTLKQEGGSTVLASGNGVKSVSKPFNAPVSKNKINYILTRTNATYTNITGNMAAKRCDTGPLTTSISIEKYLADNKVSVKVYNDVQANYTLDYMQGTSIKSSTEEFIDVAGGINGRTLSLGSEVNTGKIRLSAYRSGAYVYGSKGITSSSEITGIDNRKISITNKSYEFTSANTLKLLFSSNVPLATSCSDGSPVTLLNSGTTYDYCIEDVPFTMASGTVSKTVMRPTDLYDINAFSTTTTWSVKNTPLKLQAAATVSAEGTITVKVKATQGQIDSASIALVYPGTDDEIDQSYTMSSSYNDDDGWICYNLTDFKYYNYFSVMVTSIDVNNFQMDSVLATEVSDTSVTQFLVAKSGAVIKTSAGLRVGVPFIYIDGKWKHVTPCIAKTTSNELTDTDWYKSQTISELLEAVSK